jgi:adenine-specific DNA-methyltransferase
MSRLSQGTAESGEKLFGPSGLLRIAESFAESNDCTLYPGDCRELLAQIPTAAAQLVVTSPPYNLGKPYETRLRLEEYLQQQREIIAECVRILHPRGSLCWQVGNYVEKGAILPLDIVLYPLFAQPYSSGGTPYAQYL